MAFFCKSFVQFFPETMTSDVCHGQSPSEPDKTGVNNLKSEEIKNNDEKQNKDNDNSAALPQQQQQLYE
jgi:hypothetical protein